MPHSGEGGVTGTRCEVAAKQAKLSAPFHVVSQDEMEMPGRAGAQAAGVFLGDELRLTEVVFRRKLSRLRVFLRLDAPVAFGNPNGPSASSFARRPPKGFVGMWPIVRMNVVGVVIGPGLVGEDTPDQRGRVDTPGGSTPR